MSYTYTTLKQAIKDYTENDETTFVNNLPVFIRNTEEAYFKKRAVKFVSTQCQRNNDLF